MIPVRCKLAALFAVLISVVPLTARAALEANPLVLYNAMKAAYDKAQAHDWDFRDQEVYFSTIVNAGRAYSLQRPNDPAYGELATLTVQIGAGLHYDPLTNHDAATWYVREASLWVIKNGPSDLVSDAKALLRRVNAEDHPEAMAVYADRDAAANAKQYPGNVAATLQRLEADWRGWLLTDDSSWRSLAFERAAEPDFPLAHLPTTYGPAFLRAVEGAAQGGSGFTAGDRHNAKTILRRLKELKIPLVIASVHAMPPDVYLTTLAPADEYFGKMGYSILGIENELKHINFMLNYHYGNREAKQTVLVAQAIDDMQKVYPRDRAMPRLLYWCLTTLDRMTAPDARRAAARLRAILTVEYQDSPQALKVLAPAVTSS
jgi:hypothetical protein